MKPAGGLDKLLDFVRFTHKFQQIKRVVMVVGENRSENDFEHSFQLAMVAWFLIENDNLPLDLNKIIQFALVHDLVEAYAGDTYIFGNSKNIESKEKREKKARGTLMKSFPKLKKLHQLIAEYETHESAESKFVYSLDKLLPVINIYIDNGRTWKMEKVNLEMLKIAKGEKISVSPDVKKYYKSFVEILEKNPNLFGKPRRK